MEDQESDLPFEKGKCGVCLLFGWVFLLLLSCRLHETSETTIYCVTVWGIRGLTQAESRKDYNNVISCQLVQVIAFGGRQWADWRVCQFAV